jgi:NitT/TauT family transport system permease protein
MSEPMIAPAHGRRIPLDLDEIAARQRTARLRARRREQVVQNSLRVVMVLGFLGLWYLLSLRWPPIIMPGPRAVLQTLVTQFPSLVANARLTLLEVLYGFLLGGSIGFGLGLLVARSSLAEAALRPFVVASQAVPKSALAPLFVIWFGFGISSKVVVAAAISFFPLFENTVVGVTRVEEGYLKVFRCAGASEWQTFWKLRLISAAPYIFVAMRVCIVYALIGAVVGEFVSGQEGLGALVVTAQGNFDTTLLFAALICLTLVGVALYAGAALAETLALRRLHLQMGYGDKQAPRAAGPG